MLSVFRIHYGPSLEKISHSFTISKKFVLAWFFAKISSTSSFNDVSESVDGLQIRVNLANPKIKIQRL